MISMNAVWEETSAFIARERRLLVPLAMATMLLGDCIATLAGAAGEGAASRIVFLLGLVWSLTGQLAVSLLVLRPGSTVAEALRAGMNRLPWLLLPFALLSLVFALVLTPAVGTIVTSGYDPAKPETIVNVPGWTGFYLAAVGAIMAWAGVRLALLLPLIADKGLRPLIALRSAFNLTKGYALRMFGVLLVYAFVTILLTSATRFVVGALAALIGTALGSPFTQAVIVALASGAVGAALTLTATVFLAQLYRRASSGI